MNDGENPDFAQNSDTVDRKTENCIKYGRGKRK